MGELMEMILLIETLDKDGGQEDQLEKFFQTFKKFNGGKPIKQELLTEVTDFLKKKWASDKNNFLISPQDQAMFDQLP